MKKVLLVTTAFATLSTPVFSASLECKNLNDCLKGYSDISKKEYVVAKKLKGDNFDFKVEGPIEKIDHSLSFLLNQHGYTRIAQPKSGTNVIIPTRNIRYTPTPLVDSSNLDSIPMNYDYFMVKHKLKNKFLGKDITRSLRPFMSRYGRIIINQTPGIITLQDTGINIHRLMKLIEDYDVELSKEEVEEIKRAQKEERKHHRRLDMLKAKHRKRG